MMLSPVGAALALQLIGGLWLMLRSPRPSTFVGALLILLAYGTAGHSAQRGLITSVTVFLHVAAAAWWLGGLWTLTLAQRHMPSTFVEFVGRFSRQAIWIVLLLLSAALFTAALLLEFRLDLNSGYVRGLLAKAALTLALLALAGGNKLLLAPRLPTSQGAARWLQRSIRAELVLLGCVIAVTAWLTTWHSPNETIHSRQQLPAGPIEVIDAWAPEMPGGVGNGAGYMTLVNHQSVADRLTEATSPWAERVTLHDSTQADGISRMRGVVAVDVPAQGRAILAQGATHLMFTGLYAPFVAGDVVPIVLVFEKAGRVELSLTVRPLNGLAAHVH
ncbi:MAG: copper chaperone PCu(A)C [Proteobacteria bacterium]|nr:copper chaperone PCu(A)C [Pseudomonadota bacterium]